MAVASSGFFICLFFLIWLEDTVLLVTLYVKNKALEDVLLEQDNQQPGGAMWPIVKPNYSEHHFPNAACDNVSQHVTLKGFAE